MAKAFVGFQTEKDWEAMLRHGKGIWVDEVGDDLSRILEKEWAELPEGGFLGGPSWGCGLLEDGRFVVNSRKVVEEFRRGLENGSERFLGGSDHPCWMIFKRKAKREKVLLVSGCDAKQMNFFGKITKRNHEGYAERHGYETRWHVWDEAVWGSGREALVWAKLKVVADALGEGEWDQVWWIDADAAVLNLERGIDGFLHPDWDGVFSEFQGQERPMLSTGVFGARLGLEPLLRNLWRDGARGGEFNEETALIDAIEKAPVSWAGLQAVNHSLFNGVYGWNMKSDDPERTFVCHLVGQSNKARRRFFWEVNKGLGLGLGL